MRSAKLTVNGTAYEGWTTVSVSRSIEAVCGTFSLSVSERFPEAKLPWPIKNGDACTVGLGADVLITGFIDKRKIGYAARDHTFAVMGRDKTCDLVDCSTALTVWEFSGLKCDAIVRKIAAQYGITVSVAAGVTIPGARDKFALNPGESAFEAIDRICRLSGVLAVSDSRGGLLLTQTGKAQCVTALVEGVNVLSANADFDDEKRFAKYIVRGHGAGSDDNFGASVAAVTADAADAAARAGRTLIIRGESNITTAQARDRAQWEAAVRAARSTKVEVTVQGWTQGDDSLWPLNAIVHYESPLHGIAADMLVTEQTFGLDDNAGTTTTMTLMRPDAFKPEPVVLKKTKGAGGDDFF